MEQNLAEMIIGELGKHHLLKSQFPEYRQYFIDVLVSTEVPQSKRFYEEIKPNEITIRGSDENQRHKLSLGRILRNELAEDYELSWIKAQYEALISSLGAFDYEVLARNIRMNKDLVKMMQQSKHDYSLLGRIDAHEDFSGEVSVMPILIIPNAMDLSKISVWESGNVIPREGIFDSIGKTIRGWYSLR